MAEKPIWATAAVPLSFDCNENGTNSQRIFSPDGKATVEIRCHDRNVDGDSTFFLHVTEQNGEAQDAELPEGAKELLWSPDSKAFFVNGGENAYAGFFVVIYQISNHQLRKTTVTDGAQRDMVASFPPCKAYNRSNKVCKEIELDPEYNMTGLAWVTDSSAIVVMAEVPCSSSYGGIMCQVLGYVLEVPTGKIIQRMTARELKARWQQSMTWQMRIPDPPEYGRPLDHD